MADMLSIACRELGLPQGSVARNDRLDDRFTDSLDWLDFITCLRSEAGPITDEQATGAETFGDLADALGETR
jgi:Phosphopantetheine attachment site